MIFTKGQYFDELLYGMTREEFIDRHGSQIFKLLTTVQFKL